MARLHGGRRLREAATLALGGREGGRCSALGRSPLLGTEGRGVVDDDALWDARGGPRRARVPCELLRGRRVRAVGRGAAAHRGGVGSGRRGLPGGGELRREWHLSSPA